MKITKRQLRRIIKEERRKLLESNPYGAPPRPGEQGSADGLSRKEARRSLEFAADEYIYARNREGETDPSAIFRELTDIIENLLVDAELDGEIDTSMY